MPFANAQKRGTLAHTGVLRFVLQTPPYCFNIKSRLPNTKSEIKWIYFYSTREKCMHAVEERGLVMTDASLFEGARFSFYSVTCNMMRFARAFIWNKDSGNSCGKSVIIGTFIHTFLTTLICMIHSNLVNTFWMPDYLFWVEAPCNLLEHVEIHFVWRLFTEILPTYGFLLFVCFCLGGRCSLCLTGNQVHHSFHFKSYQGLLWRSYCYVDSHCLIRICDKLAWPHSVTLFCVCANLTVLGLALG